MPPAKAKQQDLTVSPTRTGHLLSNIETPRKTVKTTIAIRNQNSKAFAIDADIVEIEGFTCGVHRNVKGNGWACTFVGKAIAAAVITGGTKAAVVELATSRIQRAGVEAVQAKLDLVPDAEPIEGLPRWEAPAKEAPTVNVTQIINAISDRSGVSSEIIARVICSKGKNAGRLLATCPPVFGPKADPAGAAVWLGLQPNPWKVSVGKILFLPKEQQEVCVQLGKIKWPAWLDSDKAALVAFGVW